VLAAADVLPRAELLRTVLLDELGWTVGIRRLLRAETAAGWSQPAWRARGRAAPTGRRSWSPCVWERRAAVVVQEWVEAERLRPVRADPNRCELG
jgi:hypothetical protein